MYLVHVEVAEGNKLAAVSHGRTKLLVHIRHISTRNLLYKHGQLQRHAILFNRIFLDQQGR